MSTERLALHTPYPAIAARISDIVRRLPRGRTTVIVDRTGAHAAYDMLVEKGLSPIGLTISGGDSVHWDGRYVTRLCRAPPAAAEYRNHGDRRRHRRDMARQTRS